ncbi:MAG: hypothetical protein PHF37_08275 [Phycisphaerae bacterium]|nr:hypothetical protein [Phycisphaerae bacterium]
MNRHKTFFLLRFVIVTIVTVSVSVAMLGYRDIVHRNESMRAMNQLGKKVTAYREKNRMSPPDYLIDRLLENVEGRERLGILKYRSRWIGLDSKPDEILAYSFKEFNSPFMDDGYAVMRLSGEVEWMEKGEFEKQLDQQQSEEEKHFFNTGIE